MSPFAQRVLSLAGGVLSAGVLLTQARSALVAVLAGLTVGVDWFTARSVVRSRCRSTCGCAGSFSSDGVGSYPGSWNQLSFGGLGEVRRIDRRQALDRIRVLLHHSDRGRQQDFLNHAHNLVLSAWFRGGVVSAVAMAFILLGGIYWATRYWITMRQITPLCVIVTMTSLPECSIINWSATYPAWKRVTSWLPIGLCIGAELAVRGAQPKLQSANRALTKITISQKSSY